MGYVDVYSVEDYSQRVMELTAKIYGMNSEAEIVERERTLMQQIEILQDKEQQIFDILGVKNIEQLNKRIQEFQQATFNLNGPQLYDFFIREMDEKFQKASSDFNKDVMAIINSTLQKEGASSFIEYGREKTMELVESLLLNNTSGRRIKISKGFASEKISPSKFTKAQKKLWKELIEKAKSSEGIVYKDTGRVEVNFDAHSDYEFYGSFNWEFGTYGYTKAEAQQAFTPNSPILENINTRMIQYITSHVSTHQEIVVDIIRNKILARDPYAFFVGKNLNEITGLLGEIQGLYYLYVLTGGKQKLEWVGGIARNGKKPHQDIILNDYFGIQVKNTTKDALKNGLTGKLTIGFQSATLKHFLNQLHISPAYQDILESFYGTKMFNVPYHTEDIGGKTKYLSGIGQTANADRFMDLREDLFSLTDQIDNFLEGFAAAFMYLDVETEALRLYDGNSLFLLGGSMIVTASWILTEVLAELRTNKKRFRIDSSFIESRNIIEALNNRSRSPNYSGEVLSKVMLSSKFSF